MGINKSPDSQLPDAMTDAYHKARRGYGLFSGLLIAWELIGIQVNASPFSDFNVTLKSPEAAPYILITLVGYYAFRLTVEWYQCDSSRRALKVSRIDFFIAHSLGFVAVGLYAIQRGFGLRLADQLRDSPPYWIVFGLVSSMLVLVTWRNYKRAQIGNRLFIIMLALFSIALPIAFGGYILFRVTVNFYGDLAAIAMGFFAGLIIYTTIIFYTMRKKK